MLVSELMKGTRIGLEKNKKGNDVEKFRSAQYRFTDDYEIIAGQIQSKKLKLFGRKPH